MSTCLWTMRDAFRVIYVECLLRVHAVNMDSFIEAHAKMLAKTTAIELAVEELAETTIEVAAPFLE